MGRFLTCTWVVYCLTSGTFAEAQCCHPWPISHGCIVHPIYIPHCCPSPCPHPHLSFKPSCHCGGFHPSECCPHSTHKIPCSGADGYFGRHGVIYIDGKQGLVFYNVGGTMRLDVLVHHKSAPHYDHYVETFGRGEWAIAKHPYCRVHEIYFRAAVTEPWTEKNRIDYARHECVSPSSNSQLFQQILNTKFTPGSQEAPAAEKVELAVGTPESPVTHQNPATMTLPNSEVAAIDEALLMTSRPAFQPSRNRIVIRAGYSLDSGEVSQIGNRQAELKSEPSLLAIQAP